MEPVTTNEVATPDLESPVLVEGLPGIGHVGRYVANFLVVELESTPVRRVYSQYFPPVLSVDDDGTATLTTLTVYAVDAGPLDVLVLTGYGQAEDPVGQYFVTDAILDIADEFGVQEVVTLGGAIAGESVEHHTVVGAVAEGSAELKGRLEDAGVSFDPEQTPETIGGVSGLLLGLGSQRGLSAASVLGTTRNPKRPDPKSARAVLEALRDLLDVSVDLAAFDERAEALLHGIDEMDSQQADADQIDESLRYFG